MGVCALAEGLEWEVGEDLVAKVNKERLGAAFSGDAGAQRAGDPRLGSGAPVGAGLCARHRGQGLAPGPRQVPLASESLDLLSEGLWDPQANHLTSLCLSVPVCELGTVSVSHLSGAVRCPARLCHHPRVEGALVPGVVTLPPTPGRAQEEA